jgi:Cof subfamily protein (haloacid dehalogenase superfamily)
MIRTTSKYKLVAFDLDGTLIGRNLTLTPQVVEAIAKMRAAGVNGCIVTGRMYRAALPYARQLGFEAPIVCYQGAAVIDPVSDKILRDIPVPNDVVRSVIDIVEADRLHLQLYRNDEYYCEERNRFSELYAQIAGVQPIVVPSLRETFGYSPATKAIVVADPPIAERYEDTLRTALRGRAYVTRSLPEFVEVMNPHVDKGDALAFVAKGLGIGTEEVVAIGDSWNDAPLLRRAGFGIAMGSAPQELRDVANAVVGDVCANGVAEAIERYVLA